ncbi:hypothetical protein BH24DEI2_BH24DEI2_05380 [soil metagenome]
MGEYWDEHDLGEVWEQTVAVEFDTVLFHSGFLIVRTFESLCIEYDRSAMQEQEIYGIPRQNVDPSTYSKKYRGVGRQCLGPWYSEFDGLPNIEQPFEIDASRLIAKLEHQQRSAEDYLLNSDDAVEVFAKLNEPSKWEIVWANHANRYVVLPKEFVLLGYEPSYFVGDHFSPVTDSMFFPTWNGTDEQGQLFLSYFNQLNHNGLFPRANEAAEFLDF